MLHCFFYSLRRPENPKKGLLFVILSVIFMKGGVIKESECFAIHTITLLLSFNGWFVNVFSMNAVDLVWNTLKKLRVDPGFVDKILLEKVILLLFFFNNSLVILVSPHREKHDEFGDVKKVVTDEFVRQK